MDKRSIRNLDIRTHEVVIDKQTRDQLASAGRFKSPKGEKKSQDSPTCPGEPAQGEPQGHVALDGQTRQSTLGHLALGCGRNACSAGWSRRGWSWNAGR